MKKAFLAVVFVVIGASPLLAQRGERRDAQRRDPAQMRQMIMERLVTGYVGEAGLSESQTARFRESLVGVHGERRELDQAERRAWQAMEEQMRPGVGADEDSLRALMTALADLGEAKASLMRRHMNELSDILTPVQQAQFMLHWQRFQHQVDMVRMRGRFDPAGGGWRGGGPPRRGDGDRRFDPRDFSEQGAAVPDDAGTDEN